MTNTQDCLTKHQDLALYDSKTMDEFGFDNEITEDELDDLSAELVNLT